MGCHAAPNGKARPSEKPSNDLSGHSGGRASSLKPSRIKKGVVVEREEGARGNGKATGGNECVHQKKKKCVCTQKKEIDLEKKAPSPVREGG